MRISYIAPANKPSKGDCAICQERMTKEQYENKKIFTHTAETTNSASEAIFHDVHWTCQQEWQKRRNLCVLCKTLFINEVPLPKPPNLFQRTIYPLYGKIKENLISPAARSFERLVQRLSSAARMREVRVQIGQAVAFERLTQFLSSRFISPEINAGARTLSLGASMLTIGISVLLAGSTLNTILLPRILNETTRRSLQQRIMTVSFSAMSVGSLCVAASLWDKANSTRIQHFG